MDLFIYLKKIPECCPAKLLAVGEAFHTLTENRKITGVTSYYVKGDAVRSSPACGAGSSAAQWCRAAAGSSPAADLLTLSCPTPAGAVAWAVHLLAED